MIRQEYLRRLVDAAHVELYLSGHDGARIYWPWRMEPPKEATKSYRDACEVYVIDSDPDDPAVTNETVLDTAFRLDAEVASLADVYQDKDATVEALLDGLETADDHVFSGTLILPLQRPYADCWREIGYPTEHWIGLGGMKDSNDRERIAAARAFREVVGQGVHIHGFGWGPNPSLARAIRRQPSMLDSLDYSTPCRRTSIAGQVLPGKEHKSITAAYAAARLVRDLRRVSPFVDEIEPPGEQTKLPSISTDGDFIEVAEPGKEGGD